MQCFLFIAKGQNKYAEKHLMHYLPGVWQQENSITKTTEEWIQKNDSTYMGSSFRFNDTNPILEEDILLIKIGGRFYYQPLVVDQNNGERISFECVAFKIKKQLGASYLLMTFFNPSHDFPRYIQYELYPAKLIVRISNQVTLEGGKLFVFHKIE